ncbi:O-antigen ligase [Bacillus sp. MRMR6]|uniref:O-antigen ligase family protein n=1 Tax=Bacillus sp. MRMR6 TaxID=1928617 RepID=UPI000952503B|nr:O-antigen ligase family protein [Bacillus sp. MRMR6]OLS38443.1 hypothetical protein BTR25_14780 [Bacillus sp. MRMR6]
MLFFCVAQIVDQKTIVVSIKNHIFSIFWIAYLAIITFGYAINTFLRIALQSVTFDYRAYIVILFLCFTFELLFKRSSFIHLYSLLRFIYIWGLAVIGILYFLYLQGMRSLFGFYLTYAGSDIFSPFANDYHQFAYFVAPLPFVGLYIMNKEKSFSLRILALAGIILSVKIGLSTTSSTLVSAWAISAMLFIILKAGEWLKKQNKSLSMVTALVCLMIIILFFNYERVIGFVQDFFDGDTNGQNRILIWSSAIQAWLHSPIFGLGPGSYSGTHVFGGYEAHNTLLQILTQGGIIGGIAYLLLILRMARTTYINIYILCGVVTLVMYGFGINDLRRTALWFYFILFYFLCLKSKGER